MVVVYNTGPSTEPCRTPYESANLSDRVSLIFTNWCLFFKSPDITYQSESISVNVAWSMMSKSADIIICQDNFSARNGVQIG